MSRIEKALAKSKKHRQALLDQQSVGDTNLAQSPNDLGFKGVRPNKFVNTLQRYQLNVLSIDPSIYRKRRIVLGDTGSGAKSAYNVLRTRVLQRLRTNNWNKLAISSPGPSEGKTLTAINLGISMAREGHQRVVLFDSDLQRPSISTYLGVKDAEYYLDHYISGDAKPENILYSTSIENFWVIPNNRSIQNSSEILASDEIKKLVSWIESIDSNCAILFDLPPLLISDDVLAISPLIDTLLLVLAEGRTTREAARTTRELIEDHNIDFMGTVLNKSSDRMATYKY